MARYVKTAKDKPEKEDVDTIRNLVSVNRVAKVVKGGKRFSFSALVVIGDGKGRVGYASGKAKEVSEAVKKATDRASRAMVRVPLKEGRTLHHDITYRYGAGKVHLRAAPPGTGMIAGGPMRSVFECLGIQDVVSKSLGSSNPHNIVKATLYAMRSISTPRQIAYRRGKKVQEIFARSSAVKEKRNADNGDKE